MENSEVLPEVAAFDVSLFLHAETQVTRIFSVLPPCGSSKFNENTKTT